MSMHSEFGNEHIKHTSVNCQNHFNLDKVVGDIVYEGFEQFQQEVVFQQQKLELQNFGHRRAWSNLIFGCEELVINGHQLFIKKFNRLIQFYKSILQHHPD